MPSKARLSRSWVVQWCSADTAAMLYLVIVSAKADDGSIDWSTYQDQESLRTGIPDEKAFLLSEVNIELIKWFADLIKSLTSVSSFDDLSLDLMFWCFVCMICRYQARSQTRLIYALGHCLSTWISLLMTGTLGNLSHIIILCLDRPVSNRLLIVCNSLSMTCSSMNCKRKGETDKGCMKHTMCKSQSHCPYKEKLFMTVTIWCQIQPLGGTCMEYVAYCLIRQCYIWVRKTFSGRPHSKHPASHSPADLIGVQQQCLFSAQHCNCHVMAFTF